MYIFVDIVRAMATIFITNSHFAPIYTYDILAKGGAFGNSLFFLISGFCLLHIKGNFKQWYSSRMIRLYIPLLFASWFHLYIGNSVLETAVFSFIFPANYWFICALAVLYPVYYLVVTHPFPHRKYVCTAILLAVYAAGYWMLDTSQFVVETAGIYGFRFSYIFSFFLMLLGGYIRKHLPVIQDKLKNKTVLLAIGFSFSFVGYFAFTLAMRKFPVLYQFQFIETIACIATTVLLTLTVLSMEDFLAEKQSHAIIRFLRYLGSCTLEIYLVQFPLIELVGSFAIPGWGKVIIVVPGILLCAVILKKISQLVLQKAFHGKPKLIR